MDDIQDTDSLISATGDDNLSDEAKKEITKIMNACNFYDGKSNVEASSNYANYCLPQYLMILEGVAITRDQIVQGLLDEKGKTLKTTKSRPHRFNSFGDTIVVYGETSWTYVLDGIKSDFQDVPFCDVFALTDGHWRFLFSHQHPAIPVSSTRIDSN